MLLFSIFLLLNFILVFPGKNVSDKEPTLKINDILKEITHKYPKSRPEALSSYFVDFTNTKGLAENQESKYVLKRASDSDKFKDFLSIGGESSDLETADSIWQFCKYLIL